MRAELKYCFEHGIPHSIFLGRVWPNPEDPQEPQWLSVDSEKMIAYQQAMNELCPNCGTRQEDWTDENGRLLDTPIYEASSIKCHGCQRLYEMGKTISDENAHAVRPILTKAKYLKPESRN